jgi:CheY-like chemotaxis protein
MRVLLVDDNEDTGFVLSRLLSRAGHETRVAVNGEQALQLAAEFQPETVLLDIRLPAMDGYEVARRLRQPESSRRMRIVAVSGVNPDPELNREAGIDGHLVKPAGLDAVLQAMCA